MNELTESTKKMYEEKNKQMWDEWHKLYPKVEEFLEKHRLMMCGFTVNKISTKFSIYPAEVGEGIYMARLEAYEKEKFLKNTENSSVQDSPAIT